MFYYCANVWYDDTNILVKKVTSALSKTLITYNFSLLQDHDIIGITIVSIDNTTVFTLAKPYRIKLFS